MQTHLKPNHWFIYIEIKRIEFFFHLKYNTLVCTMLVVRYNMFSAFVYRFQKKAIHIEMRKMTQ